ncbi:SDR family NAD(P)-dependent oxidoreductase [uncultured Prevotella sp.]|uniref:SDR family NAD(P)-dependent oxidoreductase n=1 Tax=uncultured Prevotella sp. TaxID=159272 RepID=UPI0025EAD69B|nr:SDR family NAD(P)-dependent oxidoreductase [uncultured Prevotella sp.]
MEQRRAIIIGATSGIGLEVAKVLAKKGWLVGIAGRRQELLEQIQQEHQNIVATEQIDVTQSDAPDHLQTLIENLGGMDLYFHSSGIGYQNTELDMERELATVETNAVGMTRMVGAAFHYFEAHPGQKGQIAVISSIAGTKGLGAAPAYSATKRYVNHYLECLTQLCHIRRLRHISIHDIRPGFVRTALISGGNYPLQLDAAKVAQQIVKKLEQRRAIITIDWRYRLLVFFWRLIPRWLWVRMRIA